MSTNGKSADKLTTVLDKEKILADTSRKKLEILLFPDPRLRKKGEVVKSVTPELQNFALDMLYTMYSSNGIGLAAIQVDRQIRLLVLDTRPRENGRYKPEDQTELEQKVLQPFVIFNPEITKKVGTTTFDEGCLSVPGFYETVTRNDVITVKGLNFFGEEFTFEVDGLFAICIQHEIDHLDGKVFLDRLSPIKSARIKNKIKKHGYPDPSKAQDDSDDEDEKDEARL